MREWKKYKDCSSFRGCIKTNLTVSEMKQIKMDKDNSSINRKVSKIGIWSNSIYKKRRRSKNKSKND
jgi:hypothetical protein